MSVDVALPWAFVIGGSAGALSTLRLILSAFVEPPPAPVVIVLHVREGRLSLLPEVLGHAGRLEVIEPEDKQPMEPGRVYVAAPGYHLLVEDTHSLALSVDAPEHYSRPSIDVLFLSAAAVFGQNLVGVLLSGASADGAEGMRAIARAGGLTIVQDPASTRVTAMPAAALSIMKPTHVLPPEEIASTVARLAQDFAAARRTHV
jgi:two-component system chemotaxis response regulator CheB